MTTSDLIVCGDAACLWDDLEKLGCRGKNKVESEAHFMCVHRSGIHFPGKIEHWYGNDGKIIQWISEARDQRFKREFPFTGNTHAATEGAKFTWANLGPGTSGLNAIKVGLRLGYKKITAAGMPLDDSPHNGEPHWFNPGLTKECAAYRKDHNGVHPAWRDAIDNIFEGRVTSMSGNSKEWINGS